jgi:hypothetical protein
VKTFSTFNDNKIIHPIHLLTLFFLCFFLFGIKKSIAANILAGIKQAVPECGVWM